VIRMNSLAPKLGLEPRKYCYRLVNSQLPCH